jgi:hypothetical protein
VERAEKSCGVGYWNGLAGSRGIGASSVVYVEEVAVKERRRGWEILRGRGARAVRQDKLLSQ